MAWIKFEKDLLTDPRVLRIARGLSDRWTMSEVICSAHGLEKRNDTALPAVTVVCGALVRLWSLADTHIDQNDVLPLGAEEIDDVLGIPGFCSLMPDDWLITLDDHSVKLSHFHAHNGTIAKKKAVTQKRVERFRRGNADELQQGNGAALPDQTRPDQTKPKEKPTSARPNGKHSIPESWKPSQNTIDSLSREFGLRVPEDVDRYVAAFADACHAKDYRYKDFDAAFRNCVRQDWPKLRTNRPLTPDYSAVIAGLKD